MVTPPKSGAKSSTNANSRSSTPISTGKDMLRRVNKAGYVEAHTCPVCGDTSHEVLSLLFAIIDVDVNVRIYSRKMH